MPTGTMSRSKDDIPIIEVALSSANATALDVSVGEMIPLQTDTSDTLASSPEAKLLLATVVGTFTVDDPSDAVWLGDPSLDHGVVRSLGGDTLLLDFSVLMSPDAYPALLAATIQSPSWLRYTFEDFIDPARLRQRDAAALSGLPTAGDAGIPRRSTRRFGRGGRPRSGLRPFLESETDPLDAATALLIVAIVGPAAVGAAARGHACRPRGPPPPDGALAVAWSRRLGDPGDDRHDRRGVVLALPAGAIGAALGSQVAPDDPLLLPLVTGIAVAVVAITLLTLATVPATGGPAFGSGREVSVPRPPTPRRLVFEGLIGILAVGGAAALRERGLRADGSVDPLIAAVPALVGLAAGLLVLRVMPYPTRLLARVARVGRGLVGVLAMRRASGAGNAPVLLVLLATTTIGAFSASAVGYLDHAAVAAAWQDVGADFRVVATQDYLQRDFDFGAIPGVEASARMFTGEPRSWPTAPSRT